MSIAEKFPAINAFMATIREKLEHDQGVLRLTLEQFEQLIEHCDGRGTYIWIPACQKHVEVEAGEAVPCILFGEEITEAMAKHTESNEASDADDQVYKGEVVMGAHSAALPVFVPGMVLPVTLHKGTISLDVDEFHDRLLEATTDNPEFDKGPVDFKQILENNNVAFEGFPIGSKEEAVEHFTNKANEAESDDKPTLH